ncbi:unnamed protein product [Brachionus calyciflorus]|uniref:BTB domain-containing protein n=1 Tax=Brachionus calyciflorus TaxID=104777 RepID=A0A813M4Y4_9BILA|nr:unnamed protein product [Brachionus calyciflorus]
MYNSNVLKLNKLKLDQLQKYPHLGCWKVLYFELYDDKKKSHLQIPNESIKFELDSNELQAENIKQENEEKKTEINSVPSEDTNYDSDSSDSDENLNLGDLTWFYSTDNKNNNFSELIKPIFECNLFQYDLRSNLLQMSSSSLNFDFTTSFDRPECITEPDKLKNSFMVLKSNQDKFNIICQKSSDNEVYDKQYNFSNIFNNELLADVKINNSNGGMFYAHKSIIMLTLKENTDKFLNELNEFRYNSELIELILFYLYNDCLPSKLEFKSNDKNYDVIIEEHKLKEFNDFVKKYRELSNLNAIIQSYLNNFSFKLVTDRLIEEIKQCFEKINTSIKLNELNPVQSHIFSDPSKLLQIIKLSFEELSKAIIKFIRLLDLYSNKQNQLSKDEKLDFIKKIKSSLPFFLTEQLKLFLQSLYKQCQQSSEENRREIADYMVTELDQFVEFSVDLIKSSEEVIEKILLSKKNSKKIKDDEFSGSEEDEFVRDHPTQKNKLGQSIKKAIHIRELRRVQKLNEKIKKNFKNLEHILQKYHRTDQNSKANLIYKELSNFTENIIHDVPSILNKMNSLSIERKIESNRLFKFKDFRFAFKFISSKSQWLLNELRRNKSLVNPIVSKLSSKINNNEFNYEMEKLKLGDSYIEEEKNPLDFNNKIQLDSFFKSKSSNNSRLAKEATKIYKSKDLADITIEIQDNETSEIKQILVHGALVASRCNWFQRALNSGMQEAINRKIVLHETNSKLFDKFIEYIYTGTLNDNNGEFNLDDDELMELLTLADKYECDSLKNLIEMKLILNINNYSKSVENTNEFLIDLIDCLNCGEQFKLDTLINFTISILVDKMKDNEIGLDRDEFKQLQESIMTMVTQKFNQTIKKTVKQNQKLNRQLSESSDDDVVFQEQDNYEIFNPGNEHIQSNSRMEQLINYAHPLIVVDAHLLEESFVQLKEIIGSESEIDLNDEDLVKLLVRYDCDLNRVIPIVLNCE